MQLFLENTKMSTIPSQNKKRAIISYANLSPQLLDLWREKYPKGYADYMDEITKIDKVDGTSFYAVKFETPDAIYLVKIDVKIDDYNDAEKDIFGDEDDNEESGEEGGTYPESADQVDGGSYDDGADGD